MPDLWNDPVRQYMSERLFAVRPDTPLVDVQAELEQRGISAMPVVDEGGVLRGILSTKDLLRVARIETSLPWNVLRVMPPARSARDVMQREVVTIDHDAPLHEAAAKLLQHRIHRLVVMHEGKAAGVLSTRDAMMAVLHHRVTTPLGSVMTTPVQSVGLGESVETAIARLDDANVRGLVVVDGEWPIGVFTHTEAIEARALPRDFLKTPVEQVMSYETICLGVDTPLYRVAGHAIQMRVRRVLAVDKRRLAGIASGFDLVRAIGSPGAS